VILPPLVFPGPSYVFNFYLVKSLRSADEFKTTEANEILLNGLSFRKLKNSESLPNKISQRYFSTSQAVYEAKDLNKKAFQRIPDNGECREY
jgi:hypothetical protein